jgi:sugar lactone lactonase YvrE
MVPKLVNLAIAVLCSWGVVCSPSTGTHQDTGPDAGADADADADGDTDADADSDADADADDADHEAPPWCAEASYIWIANTQEGTVSKLCTLDGQEIGRYYTSPVMSAGDPSRTSVNLHGDAVVTNRDPTSGPSSVTKFAAEPGDCVDRNHNGRIDTSHGGDDVLPWGEDECMLWNTPLPGAGAIGARATAWDGTEDEESGRGGYIWIGALTTGGVFQLDGETGEIVAQTNVNNMPYGGAMDGRGNFWIVGGNCTIGLCSLRRVNTETLEVTPFNVPCGYGIAVDALDRIWTSGRTLTGSCVNRLDQDTGENTTYNAPGFATNFFRGCAVDNNGSVWVADTGGDVLQVSEDTVELINRFHAGPSEVVGVAVDYQDQIWAVSNGGNQALRINPETYEVSSFMVGRGPYTYSDMTGYQLRTVIY